MTLIKNKFRFLTKSTLLARDGEKKGFFPFYTSSTKQDKFRNDYLFEGASVILGSGGNVNIHFQENRFSVSSDCFVLQSINSDYLEKFLYYYLASNTHILQKGFKGAGLQHISKAYVENITIPDVDIPTQNLIISTLDKIQNVIENRQLTIDIIEQAERSIFLHLFGDPIKNKKKWKTRLLGDDYICKLERGRFTPRPRNDDSYFGGSYPFIQTGDIRESNYRLIKYRQTLNEKGAKVSKKFEANTIVIALVGATLGLTAILKIDTYATDSIIAVKPTPKMNPTFLEMQLRFYRDTLLYKAPSAARANINLSILGNLRVIVPSIKEQEKFEEISNKLEYQKSELEKNLWQLRILFQAFSTKAFKERGLHEIDDLKKYLSDIVLQEELVGKLNTQDFEVKEEYDSAQKLLFRLLESSNSKIVQQYNSELKKVELKMV